MPLFQTKGPKVRSQSSRCHFPAAMKHHHDLVGDGNAKLFSQLFIAHVLWPRDLHFQIMIVAAQGTDLVISPINGSLADF